MLVTSELPQRLAKISSTESEVDPIYSPGTAVRNIVATIPVPAEDRASYGPVAYKGRRREAGRFVALTSSPASNFIQHDRPCCCCRSRPWCQPGRRPRWCPQLLHQRSDLSGVCDKIVEMCFMSVHPFPTDSRRTTPRLAKAASSASGTPTTPSLIPPTPTLLATRTAQVSVLASSLRPLPLVRRSLRTGSEYILVLSRRSHHVTDWLSQRLASLNRPRHGLHGKL